MRRVDGIGVRACRSWPIAAVGLVLTLILAACGAADTGAPGEREDAEASRYELRGEVVELSPDAGTVTIAHEEVEGFMAAMTMPFNVRDAWVFDAAEPGARILATLVIQGDASWLEDVVVRNAADRGAAAEVVVRQPEAGDPVPATPMVDQDDEALSVPEAFEGEWWIFTFIYTTCPVEDFCPRVSGHFSDLYRAIESEPDRYGDARLLSVTVDPATDTPEVLREYGLQYLPDASGFERWSFARAEPRPLGQLAQFTGLRFMPESGEIVHSLRTLLIDPHGQVAETWVGNRWMPDEVLTRLAEAVEAHEDHVP